MTFQMFSFTELLILKDCRKCKSSCEVDKAPANHVSTFVHCGLVDVLYLLHIHRSIDGNFSSGIFNKE